MNKELNCIAATYMTMVAEAVRPQDFASVAVIISKYFKKNGFANIVKMPGYEPYQNGIEKGVGIRYFYNTGHSVRLNWVGSTSVGSSSLSSADIWNSDGNDSRGSDYHIAFPKGLSLVKALPAIVTVMKTPTVGIEYVLEAESNTVTEAAINVITENVINVSQDVAQKFVDQLTDGKKISDVTKVFGGPGYKILDRLKTLYPKNFEKRGVAFYFVGDNDGINIDAVLGSVGATKIVVTKGPASEKLLNTAADTKLEADGDRLVFEEQLKDLDSVTKLLLSGAAYSMFLAGKGGVGKTFNVEKVLHAAGKTDGNGYFKVSGTASPIGIYKTLYANKNSIVLFDDCDGALSDQDARNIIKAATDTKKERKINWMKKGGKDFYDPDTESEDSDSEEDRVPYHFIFTGKIIFISNLPLNKLDPDGALRTRSFVVNIDPTDLELVDYMAKLAPTIKLEDGLSLTEKERNEVTDLIKSMVGKRSGLSLRNLVRGLNIRASGIADWKNIITRYA